MEGISIISKSQLSKCTTGTKGILTIKGISKPVTIPFTFSPQENEGIFKGQFQINRLDYDLNRKGVGEIVDIELNIPVTK